MTEMSQQPGTMVKESVRAQLVRFWLRLPEGVRDALWPSIESPSDVDRQGEIEKRESTVIAEFEAIDGLHGVVAPQTIEASVTAVREMYDAEDKRRSSVESRLATVIGMTSIASALALGGVSTMLGRDVSAVATWLRWLVALLVGYAALQLACALTSAIRGVSRKGYRSVSIVSLLPTEEQGLAQAKRVMREYVLARGENYAVNCTKVEAMAVAHIALRNFIYSAFVLTLCAAVAMASIGPAATDDQRLIQRIRSDSSLRELLRGPQGPTGPAGPVGLPGSARHVGSTRRGPT